MFQFCLTFVQLHKPICKALAIYCKSCAARQYSLLHTSHLIFIYISVLISVVPKVKRCTAGKYTTAMTVIQYNPPNRCPQAVLCNVTCASWTMAAEQCAVIKRSTNITSDRACRLLNSVEGKQNGRVLSKPASTNTY